MKLSRVLRPAQRIMPVGSVATVAATSLVATSGTTTVATKEGPAGAPTTSAVKEWRGGGTASLMNVDQSTVPALGTSTYERRTLRQINRVRRDHHLRALRFATCPNKVAN